MVTNVYFCIKYFRFSFLDIFFVHFSKPKKTFPPNFSYFSLSPLNKYITKHPEIYPSDKSINIGLLF